MSDRPFSLQDVDAVADFVEEAIEYLPESMQGASRKFLEEVETKKDLPRSYLADTLKRLAAETWPMKRALNVFLEQEGAPLEYEALVKAVRPTTALLLKRLQKQTGQMTLSTLMKAPEAAFALHEKEEGEIALVRSEVRLQVWREQQLLLEPHIKQAKQELKLVQSQLDRIRHQAEKSSEERERLLADLEILERRFYFQGVSPSLEELGIEN